MRRILLAAMAAACRGAAGIRPDIQSDGRRLQPGRTGLDHRRRPRPRAQCGLPGSTVTYQTGSGGLANAMLLEQKKVPLASSPTPSSTSSSTGKPPFKKPIKDLRLLFHPYSASSRFQATQSSPTRTGPTRTASRPSPTSPRRSRRCGSRSTGPAISTATSALACSPPTASRQDDIKKWGGQVVRAASQRNDLADARPPARRRELRHFHQSSAHPRDGQRARPRDAADDRSDGQEGRRRTWRARPAPSRRANTSSCAPTRRRSASACRRWCAPTWTTQLAYNITKGVRRKPRQVQGGAPRC